MGMLLVCSKVTSRPYVIATNHTPFDKKRDSYGSLEGVPCHQRNPREVFTNEEMSEKGHGPSQSGDNLGTWRQHWPRLFNRQALKSSRMSFLDK